jgi:flagellar basal-body rod protein FlgB
MINALFSQPNYLASKKMLDATVLRQEAITSNIANLETPNYKRLDIAPLSAMIFDRPSPQRIPRRSRACGPT